MKVKFNPITSMHTFFAEMIKYNSSLTVENPTDTMQIQLASDAVLMSKDKFNFLEDLHWVCLTGNQEDLDHWIFNQVAFTSNKLHQPQADAHQWTEWHHH